MLTILCLSDFTNLVDCLLSRSSSVLNSLPLCLCLILDGFRDSTLLQRVVVQGDTGNLNRTDNSQAEIDRCEAIPNVSIYLYTPYNAQWWFLQKVLGLDDEAPSGPDCACR